MDQQHTVLPMLWLATISLHLCTSDTITSTSSTAYSHVLTNSTACMTLQTVSEFALCAGAGVANSTSPEGKQ